MVEAAEILIFNLSGRTRGPGDRTLKERLTAYVSRSASEKLQSAEPVPPAEDKLASTLNKNAEAIAEMLEAEILSALPPDPSLSVQVELRFRSGSVVMIGTVAIMSWAGSVVLETVRAELAEIIKIATQRAIGAALGQWAPAKSDVMHCEVTPRRSSAAAVLSDNQAVALRQERTLGLRSFGWQNALFVFLTLAVLLLLIDRFLDVTLHTAPAVPAPTAQVGPNTP